MKASSDISCDLQIAINISPCQVDLLLEQFEVLVEIPHPQAEVVEVIEAILLQLRKHRSPNLH